MVAGGLLSWLGWLPMGNTGGANVPPKKPLPLPSDLAPRCEDASRLMPDCLREWSKP